MRSKAQSGVTIQKSVDMAIEVGDQVLIWDEEELDQLPPGLYDEIWSNLVWAVRIRSNGSNYVDLVKFEPRALERIA